MSLIPRITDLARRIADVVKVLAPLDSPPLTGKPSAPTPSAATRTDQLATTAFVHAAISEDGGELFAPANAPAATIAAHLAASDPHPQYAKKAGDTFAGPVMGPTAATATNTTQLATTAFVHAAVATDGATLFAPASAPATTLAAHLAASDPHIQYAKKSGATFTGTVQIEAPVFMDHSNAFLRSLPNENATYWLDDENAQHRGALYWERSDDTLHLRHYDGSPGGAQLRLGGNGAWYHSNGWHELWHDGNRDITGLDRPGTIKQVAGTVPDGWIECLGQVLNRSTYPALYAEIGDRFLGGATSTQLTFRLPDLPSEGGIRSCIKY